MSPGEIELPGCAIRLAALRHGTPGAHPVLALHGWLDNAASFEALAPLIADVDLVALDLPGHGRSQHRPAGAWYHLIDHASDVLAAADALGWSRFTLLGHSLGAAVSCLIAAAVPERVDALWLVEGLGPVATPAERLASSLGQALRERAAIGTKSLRVFPTVEAAVAARREATQLSDVAARAIVARGLRAVDGGHAWSSDPRLTLASALRFDESQVLSVLGAIAAPTLLIRAVPPMPYVDVAVMTRRIAAVRGLEHHALPGSHHLHFEQAEAIARIIAVFRGRHAAGAPAVTREASAR